MHSNFDRSTDDARNSSMPPLDDETSHPEKIISHHDLALPEASDRPFSARGWIFELKYDGYRCLGRRFGSGQVVSRGGRDLSYAFPEVIQDLDRLPPDSAIDGELVMLDAQGRPQFDALLGRSAIPADTVAHTGQPATFIAWDILMLAGKDLRGLKLIQRKTTLERALGGLPRINFASHVPIIGKAMYAQAVAEDLEGIVGKRSDSVYSAGPTADWVTIETPGGVERRAGRREGLG